MGKSYVLKEKNGQACGYVMQNGKRLIFRWTRFAGKPTALTALYESGRVKVEIPDGEEHEQQTDSEQLLGAYGTAEGVLLMDTGENARKAYRRPEQSPNQPSKAAIQPPQSVEYPQRRWPPPPCMPSAKFIGGRWTD